MIKTHDTRWNVILWGLFFLFYYYNWSSCFLFLPMWLTRMVGLDKTHIGMVFLPSLWPLSACNRCWVG